MGQRNGSDLPPYTTLPSVSDKANVAVFRPELVPPSRFVICAKHSACYHWNMQRLSTLCPAGLHRWPQPGLRPAIGHALREQHGKKLMGYCFTDSLAIMRTEVLGHIAARIDSQEERAAV